MIAAIGGIGIVGVIVVLSQTEPLKYPHEKPW